MTLQWSKVVSEAIFPTNLGYDSIEKWSQIFFSGAGSARTENQEKVILDLFLTLEIQFYLHFCARKSKNYHGQSFFSPCMFRTHMRRDFDKRRGCKADVLVLQFCFFWLKKATSVSEVPFAMFLYVSLASLFSHECYVMCAIYWSQGKGNISISLRSTSISIRRHYQSVARLHAVYCQ